MTDCIEQGLIDNTVRDTNRLLNRFLRRDELSTIAIRTMVDLAERDGLNYINEQEQWANDVLERFGWDPLTGKPREGTVIDPAITNPKVSMMDTNGNPVTEEERLKNLEEMIQRINERRSEDAQIPSDSIKPFQVEWSDDSTVMVSLDGVSAKRQKDRRPKSGTNEEEPIYNKDEKNGPIDYSRAPDPKKRPAVETAVAHIQVEKKKYIFAAENMFAVCKLVIAFLLSNHLLVNRQLVLFSDGGRDIRTCVKALFSFCPRVVVLDWFHLRKHCNESLSMALVGGKANRNMQYEVRRHLYHILWTGNVQSAVQYLRSLSPDKIKNKVRLNELVEYLLRKDEDGSVACYAIRQKLGLRISSNPVEKANDLIVASRQKGKGMSWSREGSWALAAITVMYLNNEVLNWRSKKRIKYKMYLDYGHVFNLKDAS